MTPDVVIVGGGVIGLMTARALAAQGLGVVLIERDTCGRSASWAGGGILSPLHPWRYPAAITVLAHIGQVGYPALAAELAAETGIDPEWTLSGLLVLEPEDGADANAWAARQGTACAVQDSAQLAPHCPALAARHHGLWLPDIAQIRNPRLMQALRASLLQRNVEIRERCPMTGLDLRDGRVTGVATAGGVIGCGTVVITAGAWSSALLQGIPRVPPVVPVRGQMLMYRTVPGLLGPIVLDRQRYLIPRRDGRILVGSTVEHVGFDGRTTAAARADLETAAHALLPALAHYPIEAHWAGLRPGSPDDTPWIGAHPDIAGLYLNTGHYRNGLVLAPGSAALAAALVTGTMPPLDPAPYDWSHGPVS